MEHELPFDPAHAHYFLKYIKRKQSKDGIIHRTGPYWYAGYIKENRYRLFYIGRDLPDQLLPYVREMIQQSNLPPTPAKRRQNSVMRNMTDISTALDHGNQVIIDIKQIATSAKANYSTINPTRFELHRDPE
jgi:hypothetical protein